MTLTALLLLVLFQLKHFVADYPLQGKYMLQKFKADWGFFFPLLAHVAVHGAMTLAIALTVNPGMWWLCLVDMTIHFFMDRVKASPKYMGRWKALSGKEYMALEIRSDILPEDSDKLKRSNTYFWWALGLDQMVHHLTDLVVVFLLLK